MENKKHILIFLIPILLLSFYLNTFFIEWGIPVSSSSGTFEHSWVMDEFIFINGAMNMINNRTLNPMHFTKPGLYFYLVLALIIIPYMTLKFSLNVFFSEELFLKNLLLSQLSQFYLFSRILSALMGTATVFLVYLIAKKIFNKRSAVISSFFLSITMGFVFYSHIGKLDIPLTFWMAFSLLMCLNFTESNRLKDFFLAGFTVGLTASIKYQGILMIVPLYAAHFINYRKKASDTSKFFNKSILFGTLSVFIGFFAGTPYAIIDYKSYLTKFVQLNLFQPLHTEGARFSIGYLTHIVNLSDIFGVPLFVCVCLSLSYAIYLVAKKSNILSLKSLKEVGQYEKIFVVLIAIAIFYVKMGSMICAPYRYILPIAPFLIVLTGGFTEKLIFSNNSKIKTFFIIMFLCVSIYTITYTCIALYDMKNDTRYIAYNYVVKNIDTNSKIELTHYSVMLPKDYNVSNIPKYNRSLVFLKMIDDKKYIFLRTAYHKIAYFLEEGALMPEKQEILESYRLPPEPEYVGLKALEKRKPDYIILSSRYYSRFFEPEAQKYFPLQHNLYKNLLAEETNYKKIVEFTKPFRWLFNYQQDEVSPKITILKRN